MPKPYLEWLEIVKYTAMPQLRAQGWQTAMSGPIRMGIWIQQKAWRCDMDQAIAGLMDALQGTNGAYLDDCQVFPWPHPPVIANKDYVGIDLSNEGDASLSKEMREWVRQGQIRQDGARKGRDMLKLKGGRKW
jgi:diketogulonate reductase-like aldo/keto reductase